MFRKIIKTLIPRGLFRAIEPYGHLAEAVLANIVYGFPARKLKVIGVTGTNGKSTTARLIHTMLDEAGYKVALLSTVANGLGKDLVINPVHMTTDKSFRVFRQMKAFQQAGAEWVVLEITSHALAQNRAWGVLYQVAVMTNLTHEHLDYYGTFERYRAAKLRLFQQCNRNRRGLRVGVVNDDDPSAQIFAAAVARPITYGIKSGELRATDINSTATGSQFEAAYRPDLSSSGATRGSIGLDSRLRGNDSEIRGNDDEMRGNDSDMNSGTPSYELRTNLPGSFNISNSLAAAGVGMAIGLSAEQIERGIAALDGVEGRMNTIDEGQDFSVIVDYAHTPDSFEKLLGEMKPLTKGRLIVMFGSAGRRDEGKRAVQGELAGRFSDVVVVTEEDDRDIDGLAIMNQIAAGAQKAGKVRDKDLFLVHDRAEAIAFAVNQAKPGDAVMLLGKGHERMIERADGEHPWDEAGTARKAVQARLKE
ncbi:MAG TPA: UDP-N-acetylmuramoyl-L-alanyl-D-glutamate--2,6-diaminopimelate ligase [Candidatus Saccharimonadales bacterium]|nr:UDP-N-acetylmuramoyl-L-alanyl-D-glutamate--2,6-diaminopimelate ligase [Candidatus Saccharimonadales bacterium]